MTLKNWNEQLIDDINTFTRMGAIWHDSTLNAILSRKTYIGIVEMNGDCYEDQNLRIIDNEVFDEVQILRDSRKK